MIELQTAAVNSLQQSSKLEVLALATVSFLGKFLCGTVFFRRRLTITRNEISHLSKTFSPSVPCLTTATTTK